MKKYNYFDDDDTAIRELRESIKAQEAENAPRHDRAEIMDAIRAFSRDGSEKVISAARTALRRNPLEELEKSSKRKKRWVTFFMFLVFLMFFVILVLTTIHSVTKENERIAKFNADAGATCTQYIVQYGNTNYENLYNKYKVQGYRMTGLCYAREMDFDHDGTSELLLAYNDKGAYYTEVWGYNDKGKFVSLYHKKATQHKKKTKDAWITVYSRNNRYYIGVHSGKKFADVDLYGMRGDKFEKKYTASYDAAAEAFSVRGKVDALSFERIKLAVLGESKAIVTQSVVTKTIDGFSTDGGDAAVKAAAINSSLNGSYYKTIESINQKYGQAKYKEQNGVAFVDGLAVVDLIDFNKDGKDELVCIYRKTVKERGEDYVGNYVAKDEDKYYIEIYRYNGSAAVLAYKGEGISNDLNNPDDMYYIFKKSNGKTLYCLNSFSTSEYGRIINASSTMLRFNKSTFEQTFKASYHTEYGYTEFLLDDDEVSRSAFEEQGYQVPLFDGGEEYDASVFEVTYLQSTAHRSEIKAQVERTVANIKKLNSTYSPD